VRRERGTNIFGMIAKGCLEDSRGKISLCSSGYSFGDAGYTTRGGHFLAAFAAADGRMMSLNGKLSARNCPSPPIDAPASPRHPQSHWVPMTVCRKCPHHRKRRSGQPYPCCDALVQLRKGTTALEKFADIVRTAVSDAKEIMG
jgi:hypothetical protein